MKKKRNKFFKITTRDMVKILMNYHDAFYAARQNGGLPQDRLEGLDFKFVETLEIVGAIPKNRR